MLWINKILTIQSENIINVINNNEFDVSHKYAYRNSKIYVQLFKETIQNKCIATVQY